MSRMASRQPDSVCFILDIAESIILIKMFVRPLRLSVASPLWRRFGPDQRRGNPAAGNPTLA